MWWHDIREIRDWMRRLTERLVRLENSIEVLVTQEREGYSVSPQAQLNEFMLETTIKDAVMDAFNSADEDGAIESIHGKLNHVIRYIDRDENIKLAEKTIDKFEDYMVNVDRIDALVKEFKGSVAMSRGSLVKGKELAKALGEMTNLALTVKQIHKTLLSFMEDDCRARDEDRELLRAMYGALCEEEC